MASRASSAPSVATAAVATRKAASKLDPFLRFIEIPFFEAGDLTANQTNKKIHWPCLLFDNLTEMNSSLSGFDSEDSFFPEKRKKEVIRRTFKLAMTSQKVWSSKKNEAVAFLLGKNLPPKTRRVIFSVSVLSLHPITDFLAFHDQLDRFPGLLQSALEETVQIMGPNEDDDDDDKEMMMFQETTAELVANAATAPAPSHHDPMEADAKPAAKMVDPSVPLDAAATTLETRKQPPAVAAAAAAAASVNDSVRASQTNTGTTTAAVPPPPPVATTTAANKKSGKTPPTWQSSMPRLEKNKANQETAPGALATNPAVATTTTTTAQSSSTEVVIQEHVTQQMLARATAGSKSDNSAGQGDTDTIVGASMAATTQEENGIAAAHSTTESHQTVAAAAKQPSVATVGQGDTGTIVGASTAMPAQEENGTSSTHSTTEATDENMPTAVSKSDECAGQGDTSTIAGSTTFTTTQEENSADVHPTIGGHQAVAATTTTSSPPPTLQREDREASATAHGATGSHAQFVAAADVAAATAQEEENESPSHKDDDDDMPMADDHNDDNELAEDQDMERSETSRKSDDSDSKTDSGRAAMGASAKESVLVQDPLPPSAGAASNSRSSPESVLVQNSRPPTTGASNGSNSRTTSKKRGRPKKSGSNKSKTKTPSERITRSRGATTTPSNLALGKLGTTSKSKTSEPSGREVCNSFARIKKLLQEGGYCFDDKLYCRPGMNPRANSQAVLGRDYFDSLDAFRRDLCAYGVDDYPNWTDKDRDKIESWVRLAVVKSVDLGEDGLPDHDSLDKREALKILLNKLGYKYKDAYYLPGVDAKDGELGKTEFMHEKSLWDHLHRFGLSENVTREKVKDRDLISLELFLSQPQYNDITNTFVRLSPTTGDAASAASVAATEATGRRSNRARRSSISSSGSVYSASTSVSSKSTGGAARRNRKKRTSEPAASVLVSSKKRKPAPKSTPAKAPQPSAASPWSPDESPPPASTVMNLHNSSTVMNLNNSTSTVVTAESLSPRESRTLPIFRGTDKERLLACINALSQNNEVDHFSYGNGESRFEKNLTRVMTFLNAAITTEGEHGGCPGDPTALYICGVPGIGKTSGVKWCCNKMIEEVEKGNIDVEDNRKPRLCEVNATFLQHVQDPMQALLERMGKAVGASKMTLSNVERRLKQGGLLILVVDEIDTLVSASKTGNAGKLPASERLVRKLLEWTSNDSMRLAVIGISNSTGNDKFCRLQDLGKFKETLTFNAYGVEDIIGILEGRIGRSVMDENAMQFIGRKISNDSGDARKALKLAAKAVQICLDKLPHDQEIITPGPLVKTVHAHLANRASQDRLNERIGGLPTFTKGVLCVLSALGRQDAISVTCGRLKMFVATCMHNGREHEIPTAEDFRVSVETLQEMGLLRIDDVHAQRALGPGASIMALSHVPVRLGVQSEDVESAIIQELGQTPFFMRMRELAIEKRDELLNDE